MGTRALITSVVLVLVLVPCWGSLLTLAPTARNLVIPCELRGRTARLKAITKSTKTRPRHLHERENETKYIILVWMVA
jgi:hypothetical protein